MKCDLFLHMDTELSKSRRNHKVPFQSSLAFYGYEQSDINSEIMTIYFGINFWIVRFL
jgi:hypothetical protein